MKLTVLQENLIKGLTIADRISIKSSTLPILNNILLTGEKNFLKISATNLEIGINWWTLSKVENEGGIVVPTKILTNFISFLPGKKLTLETKDNNLFLESENYKSQIKGFTAEEFPIIPKISDERLISIDNTSFCQSLNQIVDIPITSSARPEISGVFLQFKKGLVTMTATDSFRLGERKLFLESSPKEETALSSKEDSFILPQKAAKEIINIFGEKQGQIKVYLSPNQVMFECLLVETPHPQIQLLSRLIEGDYPNYQEIIPKKFETQIILGKNEFLNQIKIASLFSGRISEVKFKVDPKNQKLQIFSQNPELGEYQSLLSGKIKGEPFEASFNHRFLVDGLLNIKSSEVIFELNKKTGGEIGPGVLKPVGDETYIYVVMPMGVS